MNCLLDWREAYKGHAQLVNRRWTGLRARAKREDRMLVTPAGPLPFALSPLSFVLCPLPFALSSSRSRPSSPDCESADAGCLDERRVASPLRCNYLWPAPALSELARASLA